mgnify:CR=1 FL=1
MTKAKKTSNRDSLENILIEGEEVLWQGKPNASLAEYLSEKPPVYTFSHLMKLQWAVFLGQKRDYKLPDGLSGNILPLSIITIGILVFVTSLVFIDTMNVYLSEGFSVIFNICIGPLLILCLWFLPPLIIWIILHTYKTVIGIYEKPFIRYAITTERIIILTNQWFYEFLHHVAVRGVVIDDGEHGATVTWLAAAENDTTIERFLGLSEFDVTHLTEIVKSRSSLVVEIEDKRQKN